MTNDNKTLPVTRDYRDVIAAVARVKDLDVQKLEQLMKLQEEWERRQAEAHFNDAMAGAQSEMASISKDSVNPATRSRYASLPAMIEAIRPIYTKYGMSVDFNEEPYDRDGVAHIVASVHCGSITRRHHFFVPWSTQGARGGAVTTSTHAKMGAITYARRGLLKMVFNLSEDDDDGNTAGGRPAPRPGSDAMGNKRPAMADVEPRGVDAGRAEQGAARGESMGNSPTQTPTPISRTIAEIKELEEQARAAADRGSDALAKFWRENVTDDQARNVIKGLATQLRAKADAADMKLDEEEAAGAAEMMEKEENDPDTGELFR